MSKTKTYLFHETSSYLPLLEGEEFDDLVEDIRQFGQIEPATLYEGKIIDGRNRYRACQLLNIELKVREWKPSEATGLTPLQYVISENIVRRHLNPAQKSEIGLLLLEEEEMLARERLKEMGKAREGLKYKSEDEDSLLQKDKFQKKILEIKEELGEGSSLEKVAPKVKIGTRTLSKAKKIKEIAKEDKKIAEDWEKAKKGDIGVDAVYKEVKKKEFIETLGKIEPEVKKAIEEKIITPKEAKEVITLPKELKQAVIKPKAKITVKKAKEIAELPEDVIKEVAKETISVDDAKDIAMIPKPELREEAVKILKKQKEQQKLTKDYMVDVGTGKKQREVKTVDLDMKIINQFTQIYKQVIMKMTVRLVDSYPEQTKVRLLKIMKETLIHLQKELKIKGDIIDTKKN